MYKKHVLIKDIQKQVSYENKQIDSVSTSSLSEMIKVKNTVEHFSKHADHMQKAKDFLQHIVEGYTATSGQLMAGEWTSR